MKIRINHDEVYEVKMPEEIDVHQFAGLVLRFNSLLKIFGKQTDEIVITPTIQRKTEGTWNFIRNNRDVFIELLKAHYKKDRKRYAELIDKYNLESLRLEKNISTTQTIRARMFLDIKPKECGLIKFPSKGEDAHFIK